MVFVEKKTKWFAAVKPFYLCLSWKIENIYCFFFCNFTAFNVSNNNNYYYYASSLNYLLLVNLFITIEVIISLPILYCMHNLFEYFDILIISEGWMWLKKTYPLVSLVWPFQQLEYIFCPLWKEVYEKRKVHYVLI